MKSCVNLKTVNCSTIANLKEQENILACPLIGEWLNSAYSVAIKWNKKNL